MPKKTSGPIQNAAPRQKAEKFHGDMATRKKSPLTSGKHVEPSGLHRVRTLQEEQKRPMEAEQTAIALEKSATEYRELVDDANSIIIRMDRKGKVTFFNNYAQNYFGYPLQEILGKNVGILLPRAASHGRNLKKMMNDILRNPDEFVENINENILKDGRRVWISWRNKGIRDRHGNLVGNLAIGQDITKQKVAEDALKESEQLFRSLFENSLDGIMITVIDGKVISANARMCEMLGMSEEEIIKAGRDGIVVQDEKLEFALQERLRTGRFRGELTFRRKEGTLMPAEISVRTFKDHGRTVKSCQVIRDITERKKMEELLFQAHNELEMKVEQRTAEVKLQAELLNLAHDAIIVQDTDGRILFWSTGAERTYGWTKAEAKGKIAQELLQTTFPVPLQDIMKAIKRESRWDGELHQTCKEGKQIVVLSRWALRMQGTDGLPEILEVNSNISVRKEAEEALRTANVYNRSLIEASLDPLVTIGPGGTITDVNAATERITGCLRTEMIGTDFSDYFTDPEKAKIGYKRVFDEGLVVDYELEIKRKDGNVSTVLYNASVYRDDKGKVIGVFAAARDVTERKQAADELLNKSKALEELNTALKVLIEHYRNDQKDLEERILSNINMRILPYVEKLKLTKCDARQSAFVEVLERSFRDITSPFLRAISSERLRFSPKEVEIISFIREGRTTKEIAQILGLGKRTIDSYRDNIRGKLKLADTKVNLRTYLLSTNT